MFSIFKLEILLAVRRGRYGVLRRRYLKWLVFLLVIVIWRFAEESRDHHRVWADYFLQVCLVQHFLLVFVLTPVFLAGAVADERRQGTLTLLLTTGLSPASILLGKLLAGLAQLASLLMAAAPPLAFCAGFGLLPPGALFELAFVTAIWLLMLGSAALCASVFCRLTRNAVLVVYAGAAALVLCAWAYLELVLPGILAWSNPIVVDLALELAKILRGLNPLTVLHPLWTDSSGGAWAERLGGFLLGGLAVSVLLLGAAALWLRSRCSHWVPGASRFKGSGFPDRVMGDEPIVSRERGVPRPFSHGTVLVLTASIPFVLGWVLFDWSDIGAIFNLGLLGILIVSLFAGFRASGSITGEREEKTWESLLTTPLPTATILKKKVQGSLQGAYPVLVAFLISSFLMAVPTGWPALVYALLFAYLGIRAMQYMAAIGMGASARSSGSWRSLLTTVMSGYGQALLYIGLGGTISACASWLVVLFIMILSETLRAGSEPLLLYIPVISFLIALDLLFRRAARMSLERATVWIDRNERAGSGKK